MAENKNLSLKEIEQQMGLLTKQLKMKKMGCTHKTKKDKWNLEPINNDGDLMRCKHCGAEFTVKGLSQDLMNASIEVVYSAIQQIKLFSKDDDERLVNALSEIAFNLDSIKDSYGRVVRHYGKGNKKGKKNKFNTDSWDSYESDGAFGLDSISFTSKKKKHK